jgi:hypothetical protein
LRHFVAQASPKFDKVLIRSLANFVQAGHELLALPSE